MKQRKWLNLDLPILQEDLENDPRLKQIIQEANSELFNFIYDIPEPIPDDMVFPMEEIQENTCCQNLYKCCLTFFQTYSKKTESSLNIVRDETTPLTSDNENMKSYSN